MHNSSRFNELATSQVLLYSIQRKTWVPHSNNKHNLHVYKIHSLRVRNNIQAGVNTTSIISTEYTVLWKCAGMIGI